MNRILLTALAAICLFSASAQKTAKRELRGAWITTYLGLDWPVRTQTPAQQQTALRDILNHHKDMGLNTMYFQVRSQSDAMYPSAIEPWSYDLTGQQGKAPIPFYDPLQYALSETRKRGMEFHAWVNPFRAIATNSNAGNPVMFAPSHISKTHPEWLLSIGSGSILNPGLPQVRSYVTSVIMDIVRRYDVDGIHFDDYFYPTGTINDAEAYNADPRGFPNTTAGKANWRRDNINIFIRDLYDSIKTVKPWVKFGVSPSGIWASAATHPSGSATSAGALQHYKDYFADTRRWLQEGWVDYIAPQAYWFINQVGSDYKVLVPWWNNNASGRHIYMGMASYKVGNSVESTAPEWLTDRTQIPRQVRMNRDALYPNVLGGIYFRTAHLRANRLNHRDSLKIRYYDRPALLPSMSWRDDQAPASPTDLVATKYGNDSVVLNWTAPAGTGNELDRARQFAVYRSTNPVIDINDPLQLIAITNGDTASYRDRPSPANATYYYAVTALDRFHNESAASNTADNLPPVLVCPGSNSLVLDASCSVVMPDYRSLVTVDGLAANNYVMLTQSPAPGTVVSGTQLLLVTMTATDKAGVTGNCGFAIITRDLQAPAISTVSADPATLHAPNHKMRVVNLDYTATDNCGPVTTTISVSSNEPVYGTGSGDTGPDWEIINDHKVRLRAERAGNGSNRVYTITITATDASGNTTISSVNVTVAHDQRDHVVTMAAGDSREQLAEPFTVRASPNPSSGHFIISMKGLSRELISIRVVNSQGRVVEKRRGIAPSATITLGSNYFPGTYLVEIVQGGKKRTVKLVKR